ncbi:MAG: tRNA uridine(34) 5-carboxymethylaminomethyl modification radical SAM/GNAT enzyme Elp3 [archaeon]
MKPQRAPTNSENKSVRVQRKVISKVFHKHVYEKGVSKMRKPTKTISGVAPLAVMLPPRKCDHGVCLYCPSLNAPQSYTPESPAVLRAKECKYDPVKQINARLGAFRAMKHPTDKIELIIMGGTFLSYPEKFQFDFVKKCYDALNKKKGKSLSEAKKINETAKHRCVALCIETRPDVCTKKHIDDMLEWGGTRVEIGVQAIDDEIYKKVNRGHTVQDVIDATTRLKKAGFKVGYHLMPGIPGSNPKKDIKMFKKIFSSKDFKPDQIKIYPCQVLKGAGIENLYYGGEYVPYAKQEATEIIIKMLKLTPRYCRIMRIMREIPPSYLVAGIKNIDMRHDIETGIRAKKSKIVEIRFREIGFALRNKRKIDTKIKLKITKYRASGGIEFFIEALNKDNILFGLLRLRLDKNSPAMVRELHVYGPTLKLKQKATNEWQHKGLGKLLMQEAEKLAKKKGCKNIRVISGVGVREYYKKLGYKLDKEKIYVEKEL